MKNLKTFSEFKSNSIHENREKHDSEILDLVDAIHEMIQKLKNSKDPEERKRASKLYTKAGPFIRALHDMTLIENLEEGVDGRPESIRVRDKINSLKQKERDSISKAREHEDKGEELKSKIMQLTAKSASIKARSAEIDWQIKQLKAKLK